MGKKTWRTDGVARASHKPHFKSWSGARIFELSNSSTLPFSVLFLLLLTLATTINWVQDDAIGFSHHLSPFIDWDARRESVRNAFVVSWDAYSQHAWGELTPFPLNRSVQKIVS